MSGALERIERIKRLALDAHPGGVNKALSQIVRICIDLEKQLVTPAPQANVAGDDEIRMLAVKAFNEAIDADGYETSYDIIANAIKAALGQTALRKDNGDELLGAHPSRFGNPDLAHEGDEPGVAVQLNGEVRGTDHRVSPLSREENTPPDDLPLSKVAASENHTVGRWIPVEQVDKSVDRVIDLPDLGMRITNSENYWMRDDVGRTFHATWADDGKRAYWWDFDSESPVNPVEFMPHPLDPRWAALASEGSDNG